MKSMLDCAAAERRIRPHVIETPVVRSTWLSALSGAHVFLKLENLQATGAFKPRGDIHSALLRRRSDLRATEYRGERKVTTFVEA